MKFGPYPAQVLKLHDGDTITLDVDLGFDIHGRLRCRAYGINAPELKTKTGPTSLAYAKTLLREGMEVHVISHGWDKYGGRFDGEITLPDGRDFSKAMLDAGMAIPLK